MRTRSEFDFDWVGDILLVKGRNLPENILSYFKATKKSQGRLYEMPRNYAGTAGDVTCTTRPKECSTGSVDNQARVSLTIQEGAVVNVSECHRRDEFSVPEAKLVSEG